MVVVMVLVMVKVMTTSIMKMMMMMMLLTPSPPPTNLHREPGHLLHHLIIVKHGEVSADKETRKRAGKAGGGVFSETGSKLSFVGDPLRRPAEKEETGGEVN